MSLPLALQHVGNEYLLFGAAALISLVAFVALILAPALSAYGRIWEKAAAGLLSLVVLAALVVTGVDHRADDRLLLPGNRQALRGLVPGRGCGVWIMSRCPLPPKARKPL